MVYRWHFNRQRPGDLSRNPTGSEFFATEALRHEGEAFVREAIQNSLDAGVGKKVRVRLFASGTSAAASASEAAPFLEGLWEHLSSEGSRLPSRLDPAASIPFLVVEDFETCGLTGDVEQPYPERGVKNHFLHFFRGEGFSDKGDTSAGRWGLGKNVFPRSSRAATFFGLTVREDDRGEYLMGRCVLSPHSIGPARYNPDGFFGKPPASAEAGLVLPLNDRSQLEDFKRVFKLQRRSDNPGLSIVIPWYDAEDLKRDSILVAVLKHYFWPILMERLEIDIEIEGDAVRVDSASLAQLLGSSPLSEQVELSALLDVASTAISIPEADLFKVPLKRPSHSHKWDHVRTDMSDWAPVRTRFESEQVVGFRCPVWIRERSRDNGELAERESYFDVYLRRNAQLNKGATEFVRGVLTVPDLRPPRTRAVAALVLIQHEAMKSLLGAAENPAHTQWQTDAKQEDGRRFKDRYVHAPSYLSFVIGSADRLVRILTSMDKEEDKSLLADIFSLPPDTQDEQKPTRKQKKKDEPGVSTDPEPDPDLDAKRRGFRIDKTDGGFAVVSTKDGQNFPPKLRIVVAYHCRTGNPFTRHKTWDFDMKKDSEIKLTLTGLAEEKKEANELVLRVLSPDFRLEATGFDGNRDLRVRVTSEENGNGDQNP